MPEPEESDLKLRTARTMKWNVIDRVSSQVLYAVTGIVLARELSHDDFGLVGAVLVFQAFANMFVDGGFSSALVQRKSPTDVDYSTVLWFNMFTAVVIYLMMFVSAPWVASLFQGDERLVPLSRVMFLAFLVNAASLVQVSRLVKAMNVRLMAIANMAGLVSGAVVGVVLALNGYGAWAIVWQSMALAVVKTVTLWIVTGWKPLLVFSMSALRSAFGVGSGVMCTVFLNQVFQNIYSFFIGNRVGLVSLGYYSQADKWSKMGVASLSQVLTVSFLPVLSRFQDDPERFARLVAKMNRCTAYLVFPSMWLLMAVAEPMFHLLFGTKWDASIVLFQLLLVRGVFTIVTAVYNNYILSLGKSRLMVYTELLRDVVAFAAILVTLPYMAMEMPDDPVYGIKILLWGQVVASLFTWAATLWFAARLSGRSMGMFLADMMPYLFLASASVACVLWIPAYVTSPLLLIVMQLSVGLGVYLVVNAMLGSVIQREALAYAFGRFCRRRK